MVLVVFHAEYEDAVRGLFDRLRLPGFTEVRQVYGAGDTGKRLETQAFPGHDTMVFSVLEDDDAGRMVRAVKEFKATLGARQKRPGGVKLFVLPVLEAA